MDLKAKRRSNAYIKLAETSMIRSQEENSDCHSCITLWHPHACAYAAIASAYDNVSGAKFSSIQSPA
ncbi:hypothetical protein NP493_1394g00009 [Ridgeia piscesae]|uniref:Uncharacterized protein n=1 Tax=Ridgeia piscesae TaxID=27915 RepID=A0AAD9K4Q0_RIDPI|nr:hypothetical protein NP493_1394g00009 [Ridgeia piscesae]